MSGFLGVVGDLVEDVVVWLREPPRESTDTEVAIHRVRGGSAANVAAFSEHPACLLTCVGPDATGDRLVEELRSCRVRVREQRRGATGAVVVLVDEAGERSMFPDRGASALLSDVDDSWTEDLAHLHVPAYCFAEEPLSSTAAELARRVRWRGATVSVDASSTGMLRRYGGERFHRMLDSLAPSFLFANRSEAEFLGIHDGAGIDSTVIVKDGGAPTVVRPPGREAFQVAVPPVAGVRDRTGAGDAFAAGFLTAFLRQSGLRECCAAAHASAARVLRSPGAGDGQS